MSQVGQVESGCYVYCIAGPGEHASLGATGIEGRQVRTVVNDDLCAFVHHCLARPYQSDNGKLAEGWVMAHHKVVEAVWKRCGAVLPLAFNTIIVPGPKEQSAEQNLKAWLRDERHTLTAKLEHLRGKAEYGFQVFWDTNLVAGKMAQESAEIRRMEEESRSKARGLAYMYRQKLAHRLRREMEAKASEQCQELFDRLKLCAAEVQMERPKEADQGRQMIINLSCLINSERGTELKALVAEVGRREGYFVRLVGPLPPYSFCYLLVENPGGNRGILAGHPGRPAGQSP